MEATCLVAKLVLVQSLALVSSPASLSAPALRPHTSAPAQSTFSQPAAAQVEIVDATSDVEREVQAKPNSKNPQSRNAPKSKRRIVSDGGASKSQEYWIVDYQ